MKNEEIEIEELRSIPDDYGNEIAEVAYSYWETRGRVDGHDVEDWLMAEQEVIRRHSQMRPAEKEEGRKSAIGSAA